MQKILIVEDELKIMRFLSLELEHEGYSVETSANGLDGLKMALAKDYDLILLDIMLPGISGIEFLKEFKPQKDTPVIILTARDNVMDKVGGLDIGADDYMTKPFAIEELLARMRAVLKRAQGTSAKTLEFDSLTVDLNEHTVRYSGEEITLTKKEFDLLVFLLRNKNVVVTRDKILSSVWGYDFYGDTNIVDVYIRYLRGKIDDKYKINLISTVRGTGYIIKDSGK